MLILLVMKEKLPIIEINRENAATFYPYLLFSIKNSTFLALDCEMSGLGDRKKLNSKSIDERYDAICRAASSRSLLSLGISCFQLRKKKTTNKIRFKCVTFNVLTFCSKDFVVEPKSLEFLIKHGFDFNVQYAKGVIYYPGADAAVLKSKANSNFCLRRLFLELVSAQKPLILHNSLVDLIFLYQNLYGPTPQNVQTFISDLSELFSAGIYDTKYIADYYLHTSASYLEYIFRKSLRENSYETNDRCLSVHFKKFTAFAYDHVVWADCPDPKMHNKENNVDVCADFALHGYCPNEKCDKSHDIDDILDSEEAKQEKKRAKRRRRRDNNRDKSEIEIERTKEVLHSEMEVDVSENFGDKKFKKSSKHVEKLTLVEEWNKSSCNSSKHRNDQISEDSKNSKKSKTDCKCEDDDESASSNTKTKRKVNKRKLYEEEDCSNTVAKTNSTKNNSTKAANFVIEPSNHSENGAVCRCQRTFSGVHRAGFDAFMTGYSLAFFSMKFAGWTGDEEEFYVEEFQNKIALSGKNYPLLIQRSEFANTSTYHDEKFRNLNF